MPLWNLAERGGESSAVRLRPAAPLLAKAASCRRTPFVKDESKKKIPPFPQKVRFRTTSNNVVRSTSRVSGFPSGVYLLATIATAWLRLRAGSLFDVLDFGRSSHPFVGAGVPSRGRAQEIVEPVFKTPGAQSKYEPLGPLDCWGFWRKGRAHGYKTELWQLCLR